MTWTVRDDRGHPMPAAQNMPSETDAIRAAESYFGEPWEAMTRDYRYVLMRDHAGLSDRQMAWICAAICIPCGAVILWALWRYVLAA